MSMYSDAVMPELGGQGGHWPPQYLADQLTLFQPGEGRLSPPITTGPPNVSHLPASLGYAGFGLEKNQETRKEF